jgi:hypothetical protein
MATLLPLLDDAKAQKVPLHGGHYFCPVLPTDVRDLIGAVRRGSAQRAMKLRVIVSGAAHASRHANSAKFGGADTSPAGRPPNNPGSR